MANRECGGCTACCKTHMVLSINKPPMTWCTSCTVGVGCRVYDFRPEECSIFQCEWRAGLGREEERPDKTRIVIACTANPVLNNEPVAQLWEVSEGALQSSYAARVLQALMSTNMPIMTIDCRTRHALYLPEGYPLSQEAYDIFCQDEVPMKYYSALPA